MSPGSKDNTACMVVKMEVEITFEKDTVPCTGSILIEITLPGSSFLIKNQSIMTTDDRVKQGKHNTYM